MVRRILTVTAWVLLVAAPAAAQRPQDIVRWTAKAPAGPIKPGAVATLKLSAEIEAGWHMYALTQAEEGPPPLQIALAKRQPFSLNAQRIEAPAPVIVKGHGSEPDVFQYDEKVTFKLPVATPRQLKRGRHTVSVEVTYQVCSGSVCLRPRTEVIPIGISVDR